MSNQSLGAGAEDKQRPYLGAGDVLTTGLRETGGGIFNPAAVLARVSGAVASGGVSVTGGLVFGAGNLQTGNISPPNPGEPGIIER